MPGPFGFVGGQGYQTDPDSGLMLLGARYYDPSLGRFLSRDPIRYAGGDVNLCRYCANDPVNATDPSGLFFLLLGGLLVVGGVLVWMAADNDTHGYLEVGAVGPGPGGTAAINGDGVVPAVELNLSSPGGSITLSPGELPKPGSTYLYVKGFAPFGGGLTFGDLNSPNPTFSPYAGVGVPGAGVGIKHFLSEDTKVPFVGPPEPDDSWKDRLLIPPSDLRNILRPPLP